MVRLETREGDGERLTLVESGANTGLFVGGVATVASMPPTRDDCQLSVRPGETLSFDASNDAGDESFGYSDVNVLIDPFGIVFDSLDGSPVPGVTITMVDADTGLPADVFGDDGVSRYPSTVVTGRTVFDSGGTRYDFPPGDYRFPLARPAESLAERVLGRGSRSAADAAPDGAHIPDALPDIVPPARQRDYINVGDLPPGFSVLQVGDGPPVTARRPFRPEDVRPIPGNRPEGADELPTSIRAIEGPPSPGRAPARPPRFSDHLRASLNAESASRGVRVRLDAEDAIDKGVPADMVYINPRVADKSKLRLRHPAIFGTRYGRMSADQQVLRSLDMDGFDPVE